jgi:hypothetical protein
MPESDLRPISRFSINFWFARYAGFEIDSGKLIGINRVAESSRTAIGVFGANENSSAARGKRHASHGERYPRPSVVAEPVHIRDFHATRAARSIWALRKVSGLALLRSSGVYSYPYLGT